MKIHEYQAKAILERYAIPVGTHTLIEYREEAEAAVRHIQKMTGNDTVVIKAQIHAGGRGKAGGVRVAKGSKAILKAVDQILGMTLMTPQTNSGGALVRKVLLSEAVVIARELYLAITVDRSRGKDVIIVSSEGGMEIEELALVKPEKIHKEWIDPLIGLHSFQTRRIAYALGLEADLFKQGLRLIDNLYRVYKENDCSLAEINPLACTEDQQLLALDAKLDIDDNALFRQKDIAAMRDIHEECPTEVEASNYKLNFIKLNGTVGCMVNGAGLAMATMDIIKLKGVEPANFLDVGGSANVETVKNGFRIIASDDNVKAILVNIFGGIVRCDRVANGIVEAVKSLQLNTPVVVRLAGTNADKAKTILANSGVATIPTNSLDDAAIKVVQQVQRRNSMI